MLKYSTFFLCLITLFTACKSTNTTLLPPKLEGCEIREPVFKYISLKSRLTYSQENKNQNARLNLRIAKDSLIWASVRSTGIEALRILFTKDSIFVMDKLEKNYYARSYVRMSELLNYEVNFATVQALLIGSMPFDVPDDKPYEKKKEVFEKKFTQNNWENQVSVSRFFARLTQVQSKKANNKLKLEYADFKPFAEAFFPYLIKGEVHYANKNAEVRTQIRIEHSEIETNQSLDFPFVVSESYQTLD